MTFTRLHLVSVLIAVAAAVGCRPDKPSVGPEPFKGPTEPMAAVVEKINARNEMLPTLWARHYFEATIVDEKKQSHFVNGDGAVLYRRPRHMLLAARRPGIDRVFEIGSTDENYWLKVVPEVDTMWWGKYEHLGKACVKPVPIDPSQVIEVLGVGTFNTDFTQFPAPTMRFNDTADAYMFVWVAPAGPPARFAAVKEVWYDRATLLPTLVILFDANGRAQLRAILGGHKPVEVEGAPADQWPKVATSYKLYFPETGTRMSFDLSDMVLDKNGVPSRRGVVFPGVDEAGVSKVIQLDEDCDKTGR